MNIFVQVILKRHKMLIQVIHIFYYQGDFMLLMWNL